MNLIWNEVHLFINHLNSRLATNWAMNYSWRIQDSLPKADFVYYESDAFEKSKFLNSSFKRDAFEEPSQWSC